MGVRQIQIFFSLSNSLCLQHGVINIKHILFSICMYFAWVVSTWWHWFDIFYIPVLWKTKRLASSAWWNALNHVVTITLNSLLSNPMMGPVWQVTAIEGTSPSICAVAIASTSPWSNLLSFPLPAFHLFFPLQYSYHSLREQKRRSRLLAFWKP